MVKRIYFFKGDSYFEYDPRPGTDRVVKGPIFIDTRFKGLKDSAFAGGIKAAVNWGDGFVYLFRGDEYWKYDALSDRADTPKPRKISDGWPTFPASFQTGIDAAFNSGTGRAYFFKGNEYLRYHIGDDRVDAPDPGTSPVPRHNASRSWNQKLTQRGVTLLQASSLRAQLSRMEFLVAQNRTNSFGLFARQISSAPKWLIQLFHRFYLRQFQASTS